MACATGIPVREWRREAVEDERTISTAVELIARQSASGRGARGSGQRDPDVQYSG